MDSLVLFTLASKNLSRPVDHTSIQNTTFVGDQKGCSFPAGELDGYINGLNNKRDVKQPLFFPWAIFYISVKCAIIVFWATISKQLCFRSIICISHSACCMLHVNVCPRLMCICRLRPNAGFICLVISVSVNVVHLLSMRKYFFFTYAIAKWKHVFLKAFRRHQYTARLYLKKSLFYFLNGRTEQDAQGNIFSNRRWMWNWYWNVIDIRYWKLDILFETWAKENKCSYACLWNVNIQLNSDHNIKQNFFQSSQSKFKLK